MVDAMVLGGLRRCEVLGLRLEDLGAGERRLFVAEGKGGRQRGVAGSAGVFAAGGGPLPGSRTAPRRPRRGGFWGGGGPPGAGSRCRRPGWMRSSTGPGAAPG